jgi:hypothetical protein
MAAITGGALAACGGGSSGSNSTPTPTPPAPAQVTGVATPQAVSVVTAN